MVAALEINSEMKWKLLRKAVELCFGSAIKFINLNTIGTHNRFHRQSQTFCLHQSFTNTTGGGLVSLVFWSQAWLRQFDLLFLWLVVVDKCSVIFYANFKKTHAIQMQTSKIIFYLSLEYQCVAEESRLQDTWREKEMEFSTDFFRWSTCIDSQDNAGNANDRI